ncbi:MAG: multiprotein bridging factor aMBF1 [Candidatus Bathycorpusculaceae bacterium]
MCHYLRCEVCGRKIYGKPFRVIIEGAKMLVCNECSKHGKIVWEEELKPKSLTLKPRTTSPLIKMQSKKPQANVAEPSLELVEDFELKVKQAREKLGLSHEELGKRINEKVSVLKKIETGKMRPDNTLTAKLEHALKIKLLVPPAEEKIPKAATPKPASRELTLGDLIQLNKKDKEKEEAKERKQS